MRQEKNIITKSVLTPNSIETRGGWSLSHKENLSMCMECKGSLFYIRQQHGIVEEKSMFPVVGYKFGDRHLAMRVIGLATYCAECGQFNDDWWSWAVPEDKLVCTWDDDELNGGEIELIQMALDSYNHTGEVKGPYETSELTYIRSKIKE